MKKNRCFKQIMLSLFLVSFCAISPARTTSHAVLTSQTGIASYFSDKFQGQRTTSGEPYNKSALTAAHASLPMGTMVRVVNLKNKHSVDVRINSRPAKHNKRLLDLSKQAAQKLGFVNAGLTKVKMTVIRLGEA